MNEKYIQFDYKYVILKYKPISKGKGKIIIAMNVDPKMDFLPNWILEKISVQFAQDFLSNVLKVSSKYRGSKWE